MQFLVKQFVLILLVSLASCNIMKETKYQDEDEIDLFNIAMKEASSGGYLSSSKKFDILQSEFPYSTLSGYTSEMLIYTKLRAGKYEEVVALSDIYLRLNPDNYRTDYYLFLKALSYIYQIRNYKVAYQFMKSFDETYQVMLLEYPDSPRTKYLKRFHNYTHNALYLSGLDIAISYQEKQFCIAAMKKYADLLLVEGFEEYSWRTIKGAGECLYLLGDTDNSKRFQYTPTAKDKISASKNKTSAVKDDSLTVKDKTPVVASEVSVTESEPPKDAPQSKKTN